MKKQHGFTLIEGGSTVVVLFMLVCLGGWITNIVKLIHMLDGPITGMFVGRIVGVFAAPLGVLLGFF